MNCPNCGEALEPGEAYFKKAVAEFLVSGAGAEDLRMKTQRSGDFLLLSPHEKTAAQFCHECGVVVIATEKGRRSAVRRVE